MASVIWDVGRDIETAAQHLSDIAKNAENYSKEELVKIIQNEANSLQGTYKDLANEYGWL